MGGMGMAGLGAAGLLASCGSTATQAAAACVGSLKLPVVQPDSRTGEVLSKVANVPAAWTKYPAPWKSWTGDPPISSGQPVTVFEVLWGAPPAPIGSEPVLAGAEQTARGGVERDAGRRQRLRDQAERAGRE